MSLPSHKLLILLGRWARDIDLTLIRTRCYGAHAPAESAARKLFLRFAFDGDGAVGIGDLLILLASWGSCPSCGNCIADLDCNFDVGVSDQNILLAAWGPCDGGGGGTALQQAVQEMGFPGVPGYQAWLANASGPEALAAGWVLHALLTDGE